MLKAVLIGDEPLKLEDVERVARQSACVEFAETVKQRVQRGRQQLERLISSGETIYGVNTGVGANATFRLSDEQINRIQQNLH